MQFSKRFTFRAFTVLWVLDTVFTTMFVMQHGAEMELNPFLRWAFEYFGIWSLWVFKAVTWAGWWYSNTAYERENGKPVTWWIDGALVFIMVPVCYAGFRVAFGL